MRRSRHGADFGVAIAAFEITNLRCKLFRNLVRRGQQIEKIVTQGRERAGRRVVVVCVDGVKGRNALQLTDRLFTRREGTPWVSVNPRKAQSARSCSASSSVN